MKKWLLVTLLLFSHFAFAEEARISLEKVAVNINDKASIKRGAKFFAANCMSCHTLIYLRYNKLATEAGITYDKMPVNVKTWPLDVKPPDLSLEASYRGADWIYTYLHSFYTDPKRPYGVNNLLVENTAMAAILVPFQGKLALISEPKVTYYSHPQWYDLLQLQTPGSMTSQQFDATITDVVNFLVYASEPYRPQAVALGYWVLGFLLVFFVLISLLKKDYWRDVKK